MNHSNTISYFRPIYKMPSYFNTREGILCFRFICIRLELPGSFLERALTIYFTLFLRTRTHSSPQNVECNLLYF